MELELLDSGANDDATKLHKRRLMSKYDSVKVYVWFTETPPHSYVLSRYLLARMMMVAKVKHTKAVKIALRLKKHLVDQNLLNVTQEEMEMCLFEQMQAKGFGNVYFERLKFVNRFFCEKRPLVITVCGAPSIGKSTFVQQMANRFNLSTVLQTDLIYEMQRRNEASPFLTPTMFERSDIQGRSFTQEYERECILMRKAVDVEITKSLKEGKALIMEGMHMDPGLYLSEMAALNAVCCRYGAKSGLPSYRSDKGTEVTHEALESFSSYCHSRCHTNMASSSFAELVRPVYIPVVVTASLDDHRLLSREAVYRTGSRFFSSQKMPDGNEVFKKLRRLNEYMTEFRHEHVAYIQVSLAGMTEDLDRLHDHFLKCIFHAMNE